MILFYVFIGLLVIGISWTWANGIEFMRENHPDYKGEDMLDEYPPSKNEKKDAWDDNKINSEGDFN